MADKDDDQRGNLGSGAWQQAAEPTLFDEDAASGGGAGYGALADEAQRGALDAMRLTVALAWTRAIAARNAAFRSGLFGDPTWNILLDLFVQHGLNRTSSVCDACLNSGAPESTALRYLRALEHEGLVVRSADPGDKRRFFVALSQEGLAKMHKALDASAEGDRRLGLGRLRRVK